MDEEGKIVKVLVDEKGDGKQYDDSHSLPPEWLDPVALHEHFHTAILSDDSHLQAPCPWSCNSVRYLSVLDL